MGLPDWTTRTGEWQGWQFKLGHYLETGQRGTGIVNVIKLQLDVNHDGIMDLSFGGQDNTSAIRPYVFWVNNDYDRRHNVGGDQEEDDVWVTDTASHDPFT